MKPITVYSKTLVLSFCLLLLLAGKSHAQQDEQSSMYMFNPLLFNPAYAGSRGTVNITGTGRFQWVGMDGAPITQFASVHAPFRNQSIGVGLTMIHDRIGARERTAIFANFAFGIRLNKKGHRLALGASAGVDINQYAFHNLTVIDPSEPIYYTNFFKASPNFGMGIYYYGDRHYIGISVPRMLEAEINNDVGGIAVQTRHFFLTGGYVFNINSAVKFKPSALVKVTPNAPLTFDVNASFLFYERFWAGMMYRFHESIGVNLAVNIAPWMSIGYAYDYPVNGLRTNQWGTHEVMMSFDLRTSRKNHVSPRYF